ncbi:GNAT family N-acetyltransferase [Jannaschia marina]|uniref:GNAT family N-acetyltransferase n=1 Tax=Jannaschia marina TaxID=2741674 RepID=UPI0015CEC43F|nr:GNAT family N-acetyltransferase [Jannaschia marina]
MTPVHIRRAGPLDAAPLTRLLDGFAQPEFRPGPALGPDEIRAWMAAPAIWTLADRAGEVVGLQWVEPHAEHPPQVCEIATFLAPTPDDMAIGTRLFEATRMAARKLGFTHIRTRIRATNAGALIYYQSRGFERLTPRDDPASGRPPVRNVEMTYRL